MEGNVTRVDNPHKLFNFGHNERHPFLGLRSIGKKTNLPTVGSEFTINIIDGR